MTGHDPQCRCQHMDVSTDPTDLDGCDCVLIDRVRAEYADTDWGFCQNSGCTVRVPIERDPLLCDEHWEAHIRADERDSELTYRTQAEVLGRALHDHRRDLSRTVKAMRDRDTLPYFEGTRPAWNAACDEVLALLDDDL